MPAAAALAPSRTIRLGENGRGCRTIASGVARLRCDLAHHLRAHVLEFVGELDFLGDGDAVLADARRTVGFVEDDVAAFRTQRHPHRVGQNVDAAQHPLARVVVKPDFLCRHRFLPSRKPSDAVYSTAPMMSLSFATTKIFVVDLDLGA
jgi:hypothetical protein